MFSNLVHLNYLRLVKCRYLPAAISVVIIAILFDFTVFHFTIVRTILNSNFSSEYFANVDYAHWHQISVGTVSIVFLTFLGIFATIFSTCDFFKYRLFVNIQNYVHNNVKYCLSEFGALLLFSSITALFFMIILALLSLFDSELIFNNIYRTVAIFATSSMVFFYFSLPALFLAKVFKKVGLTVLTYILGYFGGAFVAGFIAGFLSVDTGEFSYMTEAELTLMTNSIVNPFYVLFNCAFHGVDQLGAYVNINLLLMNCALYLILWLCACSLVTRKRIEK